MSLFTLVLDGMRRRKIRSILSILGIAIAATALFTLISLKEGYEAAISSELDNMGAHIVAVAKGCPYEAVALIMAGGQLPATLPGEVIDLIKEVPNVAAASPNVFGAIEYEDRFHRTAGVTPVEEQLKPWWRIEGRFPTEYGEILLGSNEAAAFAERTAGYNGIGDEFTVQAGGNEFTLKVTGILEETQSRDDNYIFTTLQTSQDMFNMEGRVVTVSILLDDISKMPETKEALEEIPDLQSVTVAQVMGTVRNLAGTGETMLLAVLSLAIVIGGLGTMNTMLMTVFERTREIALMKTIGASGKQIFSLFLVEGFVMCLIGSLLGIAVGVFMVLSGDFIIKYFVPVMPVQSVGQLSWNAVFMSLSFPVVVGVLAALYPAIRAAGLQPVAALKNE